jgi:hypothetical protein
MPAKATALTKKNIWETLSGVDVKPRLKDRGGFSYLPWADAWGLLMGEFPEAEFHEGEFTHANGTVLDAQFYPDETARVTVAVTIGEHTLSMWLPVMDYNNNAVKNPGARDISDAKARCLVKTLAMFGLGHSVYAGAVDEVHDEPAPEPQPPAAKKARASSKPPQGRLKPNGKLTKEERSRVAAAAIDRAIELKLKPSEAATIGRDSVKAMGFDQSSEIPSDKLSVLLNGIKSWKASEEEVPF